MTEQAEPSESQESKTPGALTRWPRELTDLWPGWAPFGAIGWPFRDIKVEEFIDGDHLVIRAELPGVDPDPRSVGREWRPHHRGRAPGKQSGEAREGLSQRVPLRQLRPTGPASGGGRQLRWSLLRTRTASLRSGCPSPRRRQPPVVSRSNAADRSRRVSKPAGPSVLASAIFRGGDGGPA